MFVLYIDPAATTALVSSITAIAVALGATGIILWRKFRKGVSKTLHIDENAHKEVEDDLVINEDAVADSEENSEEKTESAASVSDGQK